MPEYTLNRNHLYRSTSGVISFEKDVPAFVPPYMEKEIIAIGGVRVDGATPDYLDPVKAAKQAPQGQEREDELYGAFGLLIERNDPKDFTGAGVPTVKAVEKIVDFDVERVELNDLWGSYKAAKAEEAA